MKARTILDLLEILYIGGLLGLAILSYFSNAPLSREMFITFIFYPFSVFAALMMFAYFVSVRFGKSVLAYGVVLGLAFGIVIIGVQRIPALLAFGLAISLGKRLAYLIEVKEPGRIKADLVSGDLVSLQLASLLALALFREISGVLNGASISSLLFGVIIVWYMFNLAKCAGELSRAFRLWSRSENE